MGEVVANGKTYSSRLYALTSGVVSFVAAAGLSIYLSYLNTGLDIRKQATTACTTKAERLEDQTRERAERFVFAETKIKNMLSLSSKPKLAEIRLAVAELSLAATSLSVISNEPFANVSNLIANSTAEMLRAIEGKDPNRLEGLSKRLGELDETWWRLLRLTEGQLRQASNHCG